MFNDDEQRDILSTKAKIKGALQSKIAELPESISEILKHTVLSGGATASLLHNEEPKDWDLYFKTHEEMTKFFMLIKDNKEIQEYVADINEKYMDTIINGKLVTVNAVTFKNKLQVIIKQTHNMRIMFDFVHCLPYYDIETDKFFISKIQFNSIKHKKIVFNPNREDNVSAHRVEKFKQRGWRI
jgi:hypothetical protein